MTFRYVSPEEQHDANQYWADVEHKKWVCEFSTGRRSDPKEMTCYVSARTKEGALQTGIAQALMFGRDWVKRGTQRVRLATYRDLGCVVTGEKATS